MIPVAVDLVRFGCGMDLEKTGYYENKRHENPSAIRLRPAADRRARSFLSRALSLQRVRHHPHRDHHRYWRSGALDQVILQGNTSPPPVTINFAIPPFDGTVKTIAPQTSLPAITNTFVINGFTESGTTRVRC